jgi:hypothetical protein
MLQWLLTTPEGRAMNNDFMSGVFDFFFGDIEDDCDDDPLRD